MHLCRQATAAAAADRGSNAHSPQGRLVAPPTPPSRRGACGRPLRRRRRLLLLPAPAAAARDHPQTPPLRRISRCAPLPSQPAHPQAQRRAAPPARPSPLRGAPVRRRIASPPPTLPGPAAPLSAASHHLAAPCRPHLACPCAGAPPQYRRTASRAWRGADRRSEATAERGVTSRPRAPVDQPPSRPRN